MQTLASYLKARGLPASEFADKLGLNRVTVWRLANRKQNPSLALMLRIRDATDGEVGLDAWGQHDASSHGPAPAPSQGRRRRAS